MEPVGRRSEREKMEPGTWPGYVMIALVVAFVVASIIRIS